MRDTLQNKINNNKIGIVNLDYVKNNGTHIMFIIIKIRIKVILSKLS